MTGSDQLSAGKPILPGRLTSAQIALLRAVRKLPVCVSRHLCSGRKAQGLGTRFSQERSSFRIDRDNQRCRDRVPDEPGAKPMSRSGSSPSRNGDSCHRSERARA